MNAMLKAQIAVSNASFAFDKPFSYLIPKTLVSAIMPGTRVVVPFGRSNRKRSGLVLKIEAAEGDDINLKSI